MGFNAEYAGEFIKSIDAEAVLLTFERAYISAIYACGVGKRLLG